MSSRLCAPPSPGGLLPVTGRVCLPLLSAEGLSTAKGPPPSGATGLALEGIRRHRLIDPLESRRAGGLSFRGLQKGL